MDYRIFPPEGWLEATVGLPLSKSVAARRLVISFLSGQLPAAAETVPLPDDTRVLLDALRSLSGDTPASVVDVDGAGTAMRFLTAVIAATPGLEVEITGNGRMKKRPIGQLVDALRGLGADIIYMGEDGFPPLRVKGRSLKGGEIEIDAEVSSQFTSALMMIAPLMEQGLKIPHRGAPVSKPYKKLTG